VIERWRWFLLNELVERKEKEKEERKIVVIVVKGGRVDEDIATNKRN